jgi:hypothetical protein
MGPPDRLANDRAEGSLRYELRFLCADAWGPNSRGVHSRGVRPVLH